MEYPALSPIETFCVRLPTLDGILTIGRNTPIILDWLAKQYKISFILCGLILWTYPIIFTWPFWPFTRGFVYILRWLGFEKGKIRKGSYASQYQRQYHGAYIPEYSTFSHAQASAIVDWDEDDEAARSVPLYAWALGWVSGVLAVRAIFLS